MKYSIFESVYEKSFVFVDINELLHRIEDDNKVDEPLAINIFSVSGQSTSDINGKFLLFQVLLKKRSAKKSEIAET